MEYNKPEVTLIGSAATAIQSSLDKNSKQFDEITGPPDLTADSAYQADE